MVKISLDFKNVDFEKICENVFDGIFVADRNGNAIYINSSYANYAGTPREEIVGKNIKELDGVLYRGSVGLDVIRKKDRIDSIGYLFKNKIPVLVTGVPVFDEAGNVEMVVISNRNLTELDKLKRDLEEIKISLNKNKESLNYIINKDVSSKKIIFSSNKMKKLIAYLDEIAKTDASVLITGETGTGKELIANYIFQNSSRKNGPFIKINCATIPGNLIESELFGYEPGSFTGASKNGKTGIFELANKGTILLDEIGELPLKLQSKLFRVLQEKEIFKIGGQKPIPIDVRILSATNSDLVKEINNGRFREDLYYRLNVIPTYVPSLKERPDDIRLLADHFLYIYNKKYDKSLTLEDTHYKALEEYDWPGNIRELESVIERLVVTNKRLRYSSISFERSKKINLNSNSDEESYEDALEYFEKNLFKSKLSKHNSLRQAAKSLKISPSTLSVKCKKYGIVVHEFLGKDLK
ncbi:sigma 54-interacting transcriptional regulator [Peptoniphilus sp. GNH]|nr:sigma 54-interacting transcriptional regulator [Peptoniphilus sp. GNH]